MAEKRVGRPKRTDPEKQYQRLAVYKRTHKKIVSKAKKSGNTIVEYLDKEFK